MDVVEVDAVDEPPEGDVVVDADPLPPPPRRTTTTYVVPLTDVTETDPS